MSEESGAVAYKLLPVADWVATCAQGAIAPSAADAADGFIHLSTAGQLAGTLAKHYAGLDRLVLTELDLAALAHAEKTQVKWEPARAGALFPHVYGQAPLGAVRRVWALLRGADGAWRVPDVCAP